MGNKTSEIMPAVARLPKASHGAISQAAREMPQAAPGDMPRAARHTSGSLRIAETFTSLQGEGQLTGTRSFFIRTSGCNLRCWFCDTPYASWAPEGAMRSIDELVDAALQSGCGHVVLTGGEPLLPKGVVALVDRLRAGALHVTIETAGTVDRRVQADLVSISPKLAGSGPREDSHWAIRHEQSRWRVDVLRQLIADSLDYQVKFVVDAPCDFERAADAAAEIGVPPEAVWIMPQGTMAAELDQQSEWLRPLCKQQGYHYCDRMQIRWYGNRRGT